MINNLSKRNKRGTVVLLLLLFLIIMAPRFLLWMKPKQSIVFSSEEIEEHIAQIESKSQQRKQEFNQKKKKSKFKRPRAKFDPNQYTLQEWMAIGLSEKQANVILNFAKRGIYSNEQLQQIFVINDELFELIKDSTYYPKRQFNETKVEQKITTKRLINLNKANEEELKSLPGIGDFYAKKIVEYRDKLGGFISESQLLEIWKFDEEKLAKIKNRIEINQQEIKRININQATAEELAKHPYIKWNVANSIVKMRTKTQKYSNFDQLLESDLISEELLEKIKPYLRLD
ncbi:MAG TPA: helix-hairpin-helix domain-containing protein [Taishania sp.]|nr:helix-hairpin-helix domain-containing protein [Taishania sp.]